VTARSPIDILLSASAGGEDMPPCSALLGWQALSIEPGRVRVRFAARDSFCNPQGHVQGGFLAAMLDDAMGPALFTTLDDGQFGPTLEMKVSYLKPATRGAIIGEGRVVHKTRGVAFLEGRLTTEDGVLIATATTTARIVTPSNGRESDHVP
jgi:uncharacterized protein (TIGR00369 family)